MFDIRISRATKDHIPLIQKLARKNSKELGFVRRVSLEDALSKQGLHVAYYEDNFVGFVHWYARKDGWNTIRDIAVDESVRGKGVGRFLLYSVPAPIQLKCTEDNPANEFYTRCGMVLRTTETGRKRSLNVYERRVLFILCKGSQKRIKDVPHTYGMAYGTRHTETPYHQPFFVDINWKKYDWQDYCHKIAKWKPVFALVPDYESVKQRKDLYQKIRDLRSLGVLRIGCCPKFDGAVAHIPSWLIVCVSVPTRYAGFLPDKSELEGRRLHLLGGSPHKQLETIKHYDNACVISIDGNMHTQSAWYGSYYDDKKNCWHYRKGEGRTYDETLELSCKNIIRAFSRVGS